MLICFLSISLLLCNYFKASSNFDFLFIYNLSLINFELFLLNLDHDFDNTFKHNNNI